MNKILRIISTALSDFLGALLTNPIFLWTVTITVSLVIIGTVVVITYQRLKLKALGKIEYTRSFSTDGIFAGESFTMTEIIRNRSLFPLFFVEMDFFVPSGLTVDGVACSEYTKSTSIFHIPPYSTVKRVHTVTSERRDHYILHNAGITYLKNEFLFDVPIDVYVYPSRYFGGVDMSEDVRLAGEAISKRKYIEDPFFFAGVRRYGQGDGMRQVNFKASVRSFSGGVRQLMCNSYDSSRCFDTMIYLDLTDYSNADDFEHYSATLENGLRCACYLFSEAENNGGRVGFAANCSSESGRYVHIPCDMGIGHAKAMLECFSGITPYARRDYSIHALMREALELPLSTEIYYITSFVNEKNAELIHNLQRLGRSVRVVRLEGDK